MGINGLISNIGVPSIMSTPTHGIEIKEYQDKYVYCMYSYIYRISAYKKIYLYTRKLKYQHLTQFF